MSEMSVVNSPLKRFAAGVHPRRDFASGLHKHSEAKVQFLSKNYILTKIRLNTTFKDIKKVYVFQCLRMKSGLKIRIVTQFNQWTANRVLPERACMIF